MRQPPPDDPGARNLYRIPEAIRRLHQVFVAAPATAIAIGEAADLFELDAATAKQVLDTLVEAQLLHRTANGRFTVSDDATGVAT